MEIDALTEYLREEIRDEAFFRAAAIRALVELPELQTVLLFGSRARGRARPDSDWDLALIANSACERNPRELLRAASATELGQRGVEMLVFSEKELRAKRNSAGTMVRTVLLTSRLLAGQIPDVGNIETVARMEAPTFRVRINSICDQLTIAATMFAKVMDREDPADIFEGVGRSFVAATADAAEHLAKLMIDRRDVMFANTHNLNALADDLEREGDGQWSDTAKKIRDMNGGTRIHHQASYPEIAAPESGDLLHAVRRVGFIAGYLVEECEDVADDSSNPELAASGRRALEYLSKEAADAAEHLRNKTSALQPAPDSPDEHSMTADALLVGYDIIRSAFDRLAARPNRGTA